MRNPKLNQKTKIAFKNNKIFFVGGVNGVGKTSFMKELSRCRPDFEIYYGSERFMKWLNIQPGDYKSLRNMSDSYKNAEMNTMMTKYLSDCLPQGRTIVIDAHYFNYKNGNIVDTTGEWMSLLDGLFVLFAKPEIILQRIKKDVNLGRKRDLFPDNVLMNKKIEIIKTFLNLTSLKAQQISKKYRIPYFVINNNGKLETTISQFLNFIFK